MQRHERCPSFAAVFCLVAFAATFATGQVVINEVVYDDSGSADDREFVELYNAGASPVNMSFWLLQNEGQEGFRSYDIPDGTFLDPGDYYVIGATGVPSLDLDIGPSELFNNSNEAIILRDVSFNLLDAFMYEPNKQAYSFDAEITAVTGRGWWGNTVSIDSTGGALQEDTMQSQGRWIDGLNTNNNGRDFGLMPATPGVSNNLPANPSPTLPNVNGLMPGDSLATSFQGSFRRPLIVDPTDASTIDSLSGNAINPSAIPASPIGGNAIMAWDPAGGGNMTAGLETVSSFEIWAYIDTAFFGEGGAESTTYGIGTSSTFYNFPDPGPGSLAGQGVLFTAEDLENGPTANANKGIGWLYEKEDSAAINRLHLIDFGEGGNSSTVVPNPQDWTIIASIDMTSMPSDWYKLIIEFDESTGEVTARFDDQEFTFTTSTDLIGTFYVSYRESLAGTPASLRPATFDLVSMDVLNAADFDRDGDVDGDDFLRWQGGFGTPSGADKMDGDYDNDGDVDGDDFLGWQANFGNGSGSGSTAVPEPTSALLLIASVLALWTCRRR